MSKGMPSIVALLGLLAVAGYQNRDKLSEMLKGAGGQPGAGPNGGDGLGGILSGLGGLLGGSAGAGTLTGGLGDLLDRFRGSGQAETADSWVTTGPNRELTPEQVARAVGEDNIAELSARVGLSREELLQRLATNIPQGIDRLTPEGRLPTEDEAVRLLSSPSSAAATQ